MANCRSFVKPAARAEIPRIELERDVDNAFVRDLHTAPYSSPSISWRRRSSAAE